LSTPATVALVDTRDQLHADALRRGEALRLKRVTFVTTTSVLVEFLTFLSGSGERIRDAAARYFDDLRSAVEFLVVPDGPMLFESGLELFRDRGDKSYSMTDCMSMVVCRERGITDVLTYDRDFEQGGFVALMRG
jgi:predicted nucleic acid-binding protein